MGHQTNDWSAQVHRTDGGRYCLLKWFRTASLLMAIAQKDSFRVLYARVVNGAKFSNVLSTH